MDYLIRKVARPDLPVLVELCRKHAHYEQAEYNLDGKQELLNIALFSASPALFCFVVESGQTLIGYASYTVDFSTWDAACFLYLDCLYLEPGYRGYGIGEAMINQLKTIAREKDYVNIQWQTPAFNEGAIKFYLRIGADSKEKMRFILAP